MKVEGEGTPLILQNGQKQGKMMKNQDITAVHLQDGWCKITPGSFQMLKTFQDVPFCQFEACPFGSHPYIIQVFPNSLYGVAYEKFEAGS